MGGERHSLNDNVGEESEASGLRFCIHHHASLPSRQILTWVEKFVRRCHVHRDIFAEGKVEPPLVSRLVHPEPGGGDRC